MFDVVRFRLILIINKEIEKEKEKRKRSKWRRHDWVGVMSFKKKYPLVADFMNGVHSFLPFFSLASLAACSSFSFSRALLALVPVKRSKLWWASPTRLISPLEASSWMRERATDPFTLNFSTRTARVTQRIFGTSVRILSYFFCSRKTSLLALSATLTFPHFFAFAFAPLCLAAWALFEAAAPFWAPLYCSFFA